MKKILGFSLLGLLVVGTLGYVTLQFFLGSIVKAGVNKFGPGITQTKVELEAAQISPLSGEGTLSGLVIGNPPGWSHADAFRLGKVHLSMEPFSLMKDRVVINELVIEQPQINYETKIVASNIGDLLKNIEQGIGGKTTEPKTADEKPTKIEIKRLVLRDGRVTLGLGASAMTLPLPPIDMTNVGTAEGGLTPAQLAGAIMRHIIPSVVLATTEAFAKTGGTGGAAALEGARQVGEALKGIFGGEKAKQPAAP